MFFSYFSRKTYDVTPHLNCLDKTVLMMGHNIHFTGAIWKIIPFTPCCLEHYSQVRPFAICIQVLRNQLTNNED